MGFEQLINKVRAGRGRARSEGAPRRPPTGASSSVRGARRGRRDASSSPGWSAASWSAAPNRCAPRRAAAHADAAGRPCCRACSPAAARRSPLEQAGRQPRDTAAEAPTADAGAPRRSIRNAARAARRPNRRAVTPNHAGRRHPEPRPPSRDPPAAHDADAGAAAPRPRQHSPRCVLATLAVGYTLWAAQDLMLPVLLAMFFALVGNPIIRVLQRLWMPRFLGALLVLVGGLLGRWRAGQPADRAGRRMGPPGAAANCASSRRSCAS